MFLVFHHRFVRRESCKSTLLCYVTIQRHQSRYLVQLSMPAVKTIVGDMRSGESHNRRHENGAIGQKGSNTGSRLPRWKVTFFPALLAICQVRFIILVRFFLLLLIFPPTYNYPNWYTQHQLGKSFNFVLYLSSAWGV